MRVVNPYNFISFGSDIEENKMTREEAYRGEAELLSGWLDVELIPSTPLIVPDGAHPIFIDSKTGKETVPSSDGKKRFHKKYQFMNRDDGAGNKQFYIPGSSLRGMIRSVYEAATDSCVPFLLADKPISQRVPLYAALKRRGLLAYEYDKGIKSNVWKLYGAVSETEEVTVREEKKKIYKDGKIEFDRNGNPKTQSVFHFMKDDGTEIIQPTGSKVGDRGILQYNVPVDIDKKYHIAYLKKGELIHVWEQGNNEAYMLLNSVLCRDGLNKKQSHRNKKPAEDLKKALDRAKKGEGNLVPVYYFKVIRKHEGYEEELIYLSNSSAGRIAQKRKWEDIIDNHGPCKGEKLCPACLLFGSLDMKYGLKTHIRVTDALPKKGNLSAEDLSWKTLDILGEPRTSAFEFYLERPKGASYWNFDFYGENVIDKNGVSHTRYHDLPKALPRGRKMYWHGKERVSSSISDLNATMQSTTETFKFKVFFDEITQEQLDNLIWVLTLGDNTVKSRYQHKLGHAKPLGYGSVKLIVTDGYKRTVEKCSEGWHSSISPIEVTQKPGKGIDLNKKYVQEILRMSDVNAVGDNIVNYPKGSDNKIFTWFSENRLSADTVETLPEPMGENISLVNFKGKDQRPSKGKINDYSYVEGQVVEAIVEKAAMKNDRQFGVFVRLQGNISGLLHKNQMRKRVESYHEEQKLIVKIASVSEDKGRKRYSVTDII